MSHLKPKKQIGEMDGLAHLLVADFRAGDYRLVKLEQVPNQGRIAWVAEVWRQGWCPKDSDKDAHCPDHPEGCPTNIRAYHGRGRTPLRAVFFALADERVQGQGHG